MRDKDELQIGRTCQLKVNRQVEFGFYLDGGEQYGEVLLPNGEIRPDIDVHIGEPLEVFLYLDTQERIVATTHMPLAQVGDFAYLEVAWVNNFGAFLHWGPQKDLFVPFREQKMKMMKGHSYIVHVHLDPETYRIMASAKVEHFLSQDFPPYRTGDQVELLIWQKTDLGLKAIVDGRYGGLLYDTQMFRTLRTGDRVKGYISQVRPAAKQENPFNCLKKQCTVSMCCQMCNIFYNGFMKQCLAYITIQQRHTTNAKGSHQKCDHQKRLLSSKAPHCI